jgi:[acyl-carrier-protein] S-malonyltransferase
MMAGHSFGEYTALVAAGALGLRDALPLVRYRAQVMQEAVGEGQGGMAALIGLDDALIRVVCEEAAQGEVLEAANLNSPGQVVIAGDRAAVLRGCEVAKAKGAKRTIMLAVSVPVHCSLMRPAAEKLHAYLAGVRIMAPAVAVIQNADVTAYSDPAAIKDALVRQLFSPVRWIETVQRFASERIAAVVECGPGKVLGGLTKRIDAALQSVTLHGAPALREAATQL